MTDPFKQSQDPIYVGPVGADPFSGTPSTPGQQAPAPIAPIAPKMDKTPLDMLGDWLHTGFDAGAQAAKVGIAPLALGAKVLQSIPLGWLPGGADETFRKLGETMKVN